MTTANTFTLPAINSLSLPYLAETSSYYYGEGNYNSTTYNGQVTSSSSGLINTGTAIGLAITVGAIIIFTAILVKVWKRPKKPSNPQKAK